MAEFDLHTHPHGGHVHEHAHGAGHLDHEHGWHSPAPTCTGDDTFGAETNTPRVPLLGLPERVSLGVGLFVVQPYVPGMLLAESVASIAPQAPNYTRQNVSATQWDYWELVRRLWALGEDFALIEQDVVIPEGCIVGFEECDEPWCVHDYSVALGPISEVYGHPGAFGCVRFRGEFTRRWPEVLEDLPHRTWSLLDGAVFQALIPRVAQSHQRDGAHRHYPDARNVKDFALSPDQRLATAALHKV